MGKKYIVELEDKPFHKGNGDFLYRVKGFNSLVFDMTGINKLTPYTEPNFERVRKEAYEKGFDDGRSKCSSREYCMNESYQQGLNDAWKAARKIADMPYGEEERAFGSGGWAFIVKHTASEAIEKLKAYEQEQDAEIKVGDEVFAPLGVAVITEITDECFHFIHADGSYGFDYKKDAPRKTGRHFPEIATVLKKMRGESND